MRTPREWFDEMRQIWLSQKPDLIFDLLGDNIQYFESPYDSPIIKHDEVVSAWQEIKKQNIEYVTIDMLHECKNVGMAVWRFKEYNRPEHVGSYFLKLDDHGKCLEFRQWWQIFDEDMPHGNVVRVDDLLPPPSCFVLKEK